MFGWQRGSATETVAERRGRGRSRSEGGEAPAPTRISEERKKGKKENEKIGTIHPIHPSNMNQPTSHHHHNNFEKSKRVRRRRRRRRRWWWWKGRARSENTNRERTERIERRKRDYLREENEGETTKTNRGEERTTISKHETNLSTWKCNPKWASSSSCDSFHHHRRSTISENHFIRYGIAKFTLTFFMNFNRSSSVVIVAVVGRSRNQSNFISEIRRKTRRGW